MWSLLFADDNKLAGAVKDNADREKVQAVLNRIYAWIEENKMQVNSDKTFCLRVGKTKEPSPTSYKTPEGTNIQQVDTMRDLRVLFEASGGFKAQIQKVKTRSNQQMAWILRTLKNRSIFFMRFLYKTYIRPLSDFCSQLWIPTRAAEIESLESIPRSWSRRCPAIKDQHF